jgi:hypothetical protein
MKERPLGKSQSRDTFIDIIKIIRKAMGDNDSSSEKFLP